jgi:hypothetical protein
MICLRCGYCCIHLDVNVVNPKSIRPDGTVDSHEGSMIPKPGGRKCPHLAFVKNKAVCTIHDLPCYKGTPCEQFEQFGPQDSVCLLGRYFEYLER